MERETSNPYGVFLMIEAARIYGLINRDLEYDLTWEKGVELYNQYTVSGYDNINHAEYDCIFEWVKGHPLSVHDDGPLTFSEKMRVHVRTMERINEEKIEQRFIQSLMCNIPHDVLKQLFGVRKTDPRTPESQRLINNPSFMEIHSAERQHLVNLHNAQEMLFTAQITITPKKA